MYVTRKHCRCDRKKQKKGDRYNKLYHETDCMAFCYCMSGR